MKLNTPGFAGRVLLFVFRVDRLGRVRGNLPFSVGKGNEDVSNGLGECLGTLGLKEVGTAKAKNHFEFPDYSKLKCRKLARAFCIAFGISLTVLILCLCPWLLTLDSWI